jgi:hypothetical protein
MFDDKILNIEFEDDDGEFDKFQDYLRIYTERSKNKIARDINLIGDQMLRELEDKKKTENKKKMELIPYILQKSKEGYTEEQLLSYSINDVRLIYNDIIIQRKNRSIISKIIQFIFNF